MIPPVRSIVSSKVTANPSFSQESHGVHNPYATSRKRSAVAVLDAQPLDSDHCRQDMASTVLGRPTQPHDATKSSMTQHDTESTSRKNHRRRAYRDRWEFGCSLEIGTTTDPCVNDATSQSIARNIVSTTDCYDGDTAGGAAVDRLASSNDQGPLSATPPLFDPIHQNVRDTESNNVPDDDDDLLSFVAFPTSHGRLSS